MWLCGIPGDGQANASNLGQSVSVKLESDLQKGVVMFPEYRDLITKLKTSDHHFTRLFDKHNELDQKIKNMENHISPGTHEEIEILKKEKLHLKDQLYVILKKASEHNA
jgi:uncharacterized protein YdcH (DUF465 family)